MPFLFALILWCTTAVAQTPATASTPKLRVVVPLESSVAFDQALSEAVKKFNNAQSKFQVELLRRGDSFQSLRSIIAAHYAGDLPDLALVNEADLPTLVALGLVQPPNEKWLAAKRIQSQLFSPAKCGSKPCSVPFQRKVPVWYYNRELLFKLNQPTEKIPTHWTALSALFVKLKKSQASLPKMPAPTGTANSNEAAEPKASAELWSVAIPTSGEAALDRWSALGLSTLRNPVDSMVSWINHISPPGHPDRTEWLSTIYPGRPNAMESSQRFLEQHAVLYLGDVSQWNYLRQNSSFKWGASLSTGHQEGELAWFGSDFAILNKDRVEWSQEFLDFLYRPEIALAFFKASPTLPVSRLLQDHPSWKKEMESCPLLKAALTKRLRALELDHVAPHLREEWARLSWHAIEQSRGTEVTSTLQKLLSTNSR